MTRSPSNEVYRNEADRIRLVSTRLCLAVADALSLTTCVYAVFPEAPSQTFIGKWTTHSRGTAGDVKKPDAF